MESLLLTIAVGVLGWLAGVAHGKARERDRAYERDVADYCRGKFPYNQGLHAWSRTETTWEPKEKKDDAS